MIKKRKNMYIEIDIFKTFWPFSLHLEPFILK